MTNLRTRRSRSLPLSVRRAVERYPHASELAEHDDLCCSVLIDHVFLPFNALKLQLTYDHSSLPPAKDVPKIVVDDFKEKGDAEKAVNRLLRTAAIRPYYNSLPKRSQQANFAAHLCRYLNIFDHNCMWYIGETARFAEPQGAVFAIQPIVAGSKIEFLEGTFGIGTDEEFDTSTDYRYSLSLLQIDRTVEYLMLGPARFINHDCDPSARFVRKNANTVQVEAIADIAAGDEILVSYGEDYFGQANEFCLCKSCESKFADEGVMLTAK